MSRKIILPSELNLRLDSLSSLEQEIVGVLFYRQKEDFCPIEYLFIMGRGEEDFVMDDKERLEVANQFLKENEEYHFIKFHTHSKKTIAKFGDYFAYNFSSGDKDTIKSNLKIDKRYMAMLITPKTIKVEGIDSPELYFFNYPEYSELNQEVNYKLEKIARKLNCDLNPI